MSGGVLWCPECGEGRFRLNDRVTDITVICEGCQRAFRIGELVTGGGDSVSNASSSPAPVFPGGPYPPPDVRQVCEKAGMTPEDLRTQEHM